MTIPIPEDLNVTKVKVRNRSTKSNDKSDPKKKHINVQYVNQGFKDQNMLNVILKVILRKPFECQMPNCGKRFNRKDNLKAHLKDSWTCERTRRVYKSVE